ncbi:unnamed protein product [Paramecium octaurelia]|uniref:Uncharacterized protein n=1 Tax=Paramecium octaurelia TaxID=43137 RepID=A0A8S1YPU6_PAROT|nr:unnamed protein product [Paramecium octaurelia]
MQCTFHVLHPLSLICVASHQCQRKLCVRCDYENGRDFHQTILFDEFRELLQKKFHEFKLDQTSQLDNYRISFKSMLSETERMLNKIWEELSESIKSIYSLIEQENNSYIKLIKENSNLAESSYSDLEKLIQFVKGKDFIIQINQYLVKLEKAKNWWNQEVNSFCERIKQEIKDIMPLIKIQPNYEQKEYLIQILVSLKDVDEKQFQRVIEMLRKEKVRDCIQFLENDCNQQHHEQYICKLDNLSPIDRKIMLKNVKSDITFITKVIKNIKENDFSKTNYSKEEFKVIRQNLILKISKEEKTIEFLKFLIHLTSIDDKFIQCGSNSFNLLVEMKVDLREQCFENIRIKDTSLIGANLVRCILNGSEFQNVDITGVNLNGAQLFNCRWVNIIICEFNILNGYSGQVRSVCFSPDGITLASGSMDKSICLWDAKTGKQKVKFDGHSDVVNSVCFSPDGKTLASGSYDKSIRLWDIKKEQQNFILDGHSNCVLSVCFSPDGTSLASASGDCFIFLWDVKTLQLKAKLTGHFDYVSSICFSPDSTILASSSMDNFICLWEVKTGKQKEKFNNQSDYVKSVCFSPDGTTLAFASGDFYICLWDIKRRQQKFKLDGHTSLVLTVFFSPNGTTLASGSGDKSIRLWDVKTGQQKAKLDGHSGAVKSIRFSPDGTTLASSGDDQSIRLWDVTAGIVNKPSNKYYNEMLAQLKKKLKNTSQFQNINTNIPILVISQKSNLEAQGALIFRGEFRNSQGLDLRSLLKSKGTLILEDG